MKILRSSLITYVFLTLGTLFVFACKKDPETKKEVKDEKIAQIEHDLKSGGIYKGTLVGSSGIFIINFQGDTIFSELTFDGITKKGTTSSLNSWKTGEAISNAIFLFGDWQLIFSVNADGSNPQVAITIPNHTIEAMVVKETSSKLLDVYEGTYSGDANGIFNFTIQNSNISGISKSNDGYGNSSISGTVSNSFVSGNLSNGAVIKGSLNGTNSSGTWYQIVGQDTVKGNWTAIKKL